MVPWRVKSSRCHPQRRKSGDSVLAKFRIGRAKLLKDRQEGLRSREGLGVGEGRYLESGLVLTDETGPHAGPPQTRGKTVRSRGVNICRTVRPRGVIEASAMARG